MEGQREGAARLRPPREEGKGGPGARPPPRSRRKRAGRTRRPAGAACDGRVRPSGSALPQRRLLRAISELKVLARHHFLLRAAVPAFWWGSLSSRRMPLGRAARPWMGSGSGA